jgi:antirestriction protein ArdC
MSRPDPQTRPDLYARVTDAFIADLERGVRPWTRPWSVGHLAGRVTRPLRHNLQPYNGINIVLLWSEAINRGFTAPIWMTFRQALELGGHVRKGEHGAATVVYANRITRTETDGDRATWPVSIRRCSIATPSICAAGTVAP